MYTACPGPGRGDARCGGLTRRRRQPQRRLTGEPRRRQVVPEPPPTVAHSSRQSSATSAPGHTRVVAGTHDSPSLVRIRCVCVSTANSQPDRNASDPSRCDPVCPTDRATQCACQPLGGSTARARRVRVRILPLKSRGRRQSTPQRLRNDARRARGFCLPAPTAAKGSP